MNAANLSNSSTDPYFAALCEANPELATKVLQTLFDANSGNSEFDTFKILVEDPWTPWKLLAQIAQSWEQINSYYLAKLITHPNCDLAYLDRAVHSDLPALVNGASLSPRLTTQQVEVLKSSADENVIYNLISNGYLSDEETIGYINQLVRFAYAALSAPHLSPKIIAELKKHTEYKYLINERIGDLLINHSSVSDEIKVELAILGYKKFPASEKSNLNVNNPNISYFAFLVGGPQEALDFFIAHGHPAGLFCSGVLPTEEVPCTLTAVENLIEFEFIHRALWPEVGKIEGNELRYYKSSYDGDSFALAHSQINFEEHGDFIQPRGVPQISFVRGYPFIPRDWAEATVTFESLTDEISSRGTERLFEFDGILAENDGDLSLEDLALYVLSAQWTHDEFTFTDRGRSEVLQAWEDSFDDVFLDVNIDWEYVPPFQWSQIDHAKQTKATKFLLQAQQLPDAGANLVADHFLACIALHPQSSAEVIALLRENKAAWVQQALALRTSN